MMGREIKFRAYHFGANYSVRAEMLYDSKPGDVLRWKQEGQELSDVMQYTGLKDKNGKEIYEGDITLNDIAGEFVGEVIFHEGRFTIRDSDDEKHLWILSDKTLVIGNIYESPELLK